MRLDLFLKTSRLISRRSLAQKFCDAGLIAVNGVAAKSSKETKVGDEIEINGRGRWLKVRVIRIPDSKQVSKNSAADLYQLLEEKRTTDDLGLV